MDWNSFSHYQNDNMQQKDLITGGISLASILIGYSLVQNEDLTSFTMGSFTPSDINRTIVFGLFLFLVLFQFRDCFNVAGLFEAEQDLLKIPDHKPKPG